MTKTLPAGIKEDRKSGTNKGTLLDFRDSNEWDNRTIHLWTSVLQRKGRMIKRAIRRHSGISFLPQPLGARLFPEWFPKVRLARCLWVRMLLPNAQGQDHPAELQRGDCHLEMWQWLLSPDAEPWAKEDSFEALQPDGILLDWSLSSIFISNSSLLEWDHPSCACPTLLVFWKHISCLISQVHSWRGIVNQEILYLRSHLHLTYMKFRQGFQLEIDAGMGKICEDCWDRSSMWHMRRTWILGMRRQNVMNWIVLLQNSHVEAPTPHLEDRASKETIKIKCDPRKNEILPFASTGMNLKGMVFSEIS